MALSIQNERSVKQVFYGIMAISLRCRNLPDIDTRSPDAILGYGGTDDDRSRTERSPDPKRNNP